MKNKIHPISENVCANESRTTENGYQNKYNLKGHMPFKGTGTIEKTDMV